MKKFTLYAILLFTNQLYAQGWQWANVLGADNSDTKVNAVVPYFLSNQNLVVGSFAASGLTLGSQNLTGAGQDDGFVALMDDNGDYLWASRMGGSNRDFAACAATDANGNIYVAGTFNSLSLTLGSQTLNNGGNADVFLVKYNADKTVAWARRVGTAGNDAVTGLVVDNTGNAHLSGHSETTLFVLKVDTDNNLIWQKDINLPDNQSLSTNLLLDDNANCYLAGSLRGKISFNGIDTAESSMAIDDWTGLWAHINNGFLAKFNAAGNFEAVAIDSACYKINSITFSDNHIYACGERFNPFQIVAGPTYPQAESRIHVFKYTDSLSKVWGKTVNNTDQWAATLDIPFAMGHDSTGNVYVAGSMHAPNLVFANDTLPNIQNQFFFYSQIFVFKYNAAGDELKWWVLGGSINDAASSIRVTAEDNFWLGGTFQSDDVSFGSTTLHNNSDLDSFIVHAATPVYFKKTLGFVAKYNSTLSSILRPQVPPMLVFPNPVTEVLYFSTETPFQVLDLYGRNILSGTGNHAPVSQLPAGVYFLQPQQGAAVKFVKQ